MSYQVGSYCFKCGKVKSYIILPDGIDTGNFSVDMCTCPIEIQQGYITALEYIPHFVSEMPITDLETLMRKIIREELDATEM